jgi:hypothetical protein
VVKERSRRKRRCRVPGREADAEAALYIESIVIGGGARQSTNIVTIDTRSDRIDARNLPFAMQIGW